MTNYKDGSSEAGEQRAYILGLLRSEEHERVDSLVLSQTDYFEKLESLEDELIEEYAVGQLRDQERVSFEKELKQRPELRAKLQLHKQLQHLTGKQPSEQALQAQSSGGTWLTMPSMFRAVGAFACILCLIVSYLVWQNRREATTRPVVADSLPSSSGQPTFPPDASTAAPVDMNPRPPVQEWKPGPMLTFLVMPLTRAADGDQDFHVPAGPAHIELRFTIGADEIHPRYRLLLRRNGREVLNLRKLRSQTFSNFTVVPVSIRVVVGRDTVRYEATLFGVEKDGSETAIEDYGFRVSL